MIATLFDIIAPVMICVLVGFVWARSGGRFDTDLVTRLVTNIGTPCLVYATLVKVDIDPAAFGEMALATVVTVAAFFVLGAVVLTLARLDRRAFLNSLVFPNTGNMGLPLCLLAFGNDGLALAIVYFGLNVLILFTAGAAIAAGATSLREVLGLPMLYAVVAAAATVYLEVTPPKWIVSTTEILGDLTIPLMLIALGVSLATLAVSALGRSAVVAALRLALGFGVGWATAEAFGMTGAVRGVLILQCTMPIAVFNYLFAVRYDTRPAEVAGAVVVSSLLGFLSLPALLLFVL